MPNVYVDHFRSIAREQSKATHSNSQPRYD